MALDELGHLLRGDVLALTGAGISAASGLPTFRGRDGLYEGLNPYELATAQAFAKRPVTVWNWYLMRIQQGRDATPNEAHLALVELEAVSRRVTVITSNVDPLHEIAGSTRIHKLHGDIMQSRCLRCGTIHHWDFDNLPEKVTEDSLPRCTCGGGLRPNVVWFGEYPRESAVEAAIRGVADATVVLEIGTSGAVSYGFTEMAIEAGTPVLRINPDPVQEYGVTVVEEPAELALPALVQLARAS